ncbi:probable inactive allantoicase isoform X1 [Bombyx mori]|uniref:Allantoate amidinohydrolase n=2 Tax=Bombyx mori TaxID=7091 RepID=A0A8R2AFC3_BOMMO|nr:probable allantoicase isoform X1 [Bombyx mori]
MTENLPTFINLTEFATSNTGGQILFATDDFFAVAENLISDTDPIYIADKYTEYGKWMDGWETRRKRIPGHDWCIIKLAVACVIKGLLLDTAHFTGNNVLKFSIQATILSSEEELQIPPRNTTVGSGASAEDLDRVEEIFSEKWKEIVPVTSLRPGLEVTRYNYVKVFSNKPWTHIRLNIYPDGGIARLRVYGEASPEKPPANELTDLVSMLNGGVNQGYSNAHYSHPRNILKPFKGVSMSDGWETARNQNRPAIIELNEDGTLNVNVSEWAIFKLGFPGSLRRICVDTSHFKGNYPGDVKIEGAYLEKENWFPGDKVGWTSVLKQNPLEGDKEHWFDCESDVITHIKVTISPDGGISRLRTFGYISPF